MQYLAFWVFILGAALSQFGYGATTWQFWAAIGLAIAYAQASKA
jgi:hypothetical protein